MLVTHAQYCYCCFVIVLIKLKYVVLLPQLDLILLSLLPSYLIHIVAANHKIITITAVIVASLWYAMCSTFLCPTLYV